MSFGLVWLFSGYQTGDHSQGFQGFEGSHHTSFVLRDGLDAGGIPSKHFIEGSEGDFGGREGSWFGHFAALRRYCRPSCDAVEGGSQWAVSDIAVFNREPSRLCEKWTDGSNSAMFGGRSLRSGSRVLFWKVRLSEVPLRVFSGPRLRHGKSGSLDRCDGMEAGSPFRQIRRQRAFCADESKRTFGGFSRDRQSRL